MLGIEDECIERDDVSFAQHDVVTILVHGRQLTASNLRPIVRLRRATRGSFLPAFLRCRSRAVADLVRCDHLINDALQPVDRFEIDLNRIAGGAQIILNPVLGDVGGISCAPFVRTMFVDRAAYSAAKRETAIHDERLIDVECAFVRRLVRRSRIVTMINFLCLLVAL